MRSGFWRFTADIQAALGLTSVVSSSAHAEDLDQLGDAPAVADPPEVMPKFGNWPARPRQSLHGCSAVETYFKVRSKDYLSSRVKARSAPRMFEFVGADMIRVRPRAARERPAGRGVASGSGTGALTARAARAPARRPRAAQGVSSARDICAHPEGIMASPQYQALYKAALKRAPNSAGRKKSRAGELPAGSSSGAPFIFAVNLALPRAPQLAPHDHVNIVMYFARAGKSDNEAWEALWERFLKMSPQQRGARLKLLPVIVTGSSTFQNSIANRPSIIGNKLKCSWFESANHLECIVEVGSSLLASHMWKLMLPQAKNLCMDMAWVIEGQTADELPEVVVAAAHISRPEVGEYRTYASAPRQLGGGARAGARSKGSLPRRGTDTVLAERDAEPEPDPETLSRRTHTL